MICSILRSAPVRALALIALAAALIATSVWDPFAGIAAMFGLVFGSFFNVCILRAPYGDPDCEKCGEPPRWYDGIGLFPGRPNDGRCWNCDTARPPEKQSLTNPARSQCMSCKQPIAWYDNIPVVSYILLSGECRSCSEPISPRYALVELLTATLFVLIAVRGFEPRMMALQFCLASALIVITFIDIDHLIIPDRISIPSILIAPAVAVVVGHITWIDSLIGIALGGGILWTIAASYEFLRKQEGMGFGDVKLLAMIGGLQGWAGAFFAMFAGATIGSLFGLFVLIRRRGQLDAVIPFGPFLAAGAMLYSLAGPELIDWYFSIRF